MATRAVSLPSIPAITGVDSALKAILSPIKTILDTREGRASSSLEQVVTFRDMENAGINLSVYGGGLKSTSTAGGTGTGSADEIAPGAPTGVTVAPYGLFSHRVAWTNPADDDLYYIEVWRAEWDRTGDAPTYATADLIAIVTVTSAYIGAAMYRDFGGIIPDMDYYYWLAAVDWSGNRSDVAFAGSVEYADNPTIDEIMATLQGDIQLDYLSEALQTKIATVDTLSTHMATAETNIVTLQNTDTSLQSQITNRVLITTYNSKIAAVETTLSVHGSSLDDLQSEYLVKLDVNGYVTGFGLVNNGSSSAMLIRVDKFAVGASGYSTKYPFIMGYVNGTYTVGVTGALVVDGTIEARSIAAGTITGAKLNGAAFGTLTISSGTLTISSSGILNINSGGALNISSGSMAIGSTGTITISSGGTFNINSTNGILFSSVARIGYTGTYFELTPTLGNSYNISIGATGYHWNKLWLYGADIYMTGSTSVGVVTPEFNITCFSVYKFNSSGFYTTSSTPTLGTSSYRWSNVYATAVTVTDGLSVGAVLPNSYYRLISYGKGTTSSTFSILLRNSSAANMLYVTDNGYCWAYQAWSTSDERRKVNVSKLDCSVIAKFRAVESKTFAMDLSPEKEICGFTAQNLLAAGLDLAVDLVVHPGHETAEYVTNTNAIIGYMIKWGQEQQELIDDLLGRILKLESNIKKTTDD